MIIRGNISKSQSLIMEQVHLNVDCLFKITLYLRPQNSIFVFFLSTTVILQGRNNSRHHLWRSFQILTSNPHDFLFNSFICQNYFKNMILSCENNRQCLKYAYFAYGSCKPVCSFLLSHKFHMKITLSECMIHEC